jgi:hypothetical protein
METSQEQSTVSFGKVLEYLKQSPFLNTAYRMGWNDKGQYVCLQVPDENSKMSLPYIYITTVDGKRVPWLASHTDMLSADWILTIID